jgi:dCMP deaminase
MTEDLEFILPEEAESNALDLWQKEVYAGIRPMNLDGFLRSHKDLDKIIMRDLIARMSPQYTCLRPPGAAGAVLYTNQGVLIYGDVRPADGSKTCKELGECLMEDGHCVRTIHAEVRAILNAATTMQNPNEGTMYSILKPCFQCTKVIIAAGILRVVFAGSAYDEPRTTEISEAANLEYVHVACDLDYGQELVTNA